MNQREGENQISKNTKSITSLTYIAEAQEDHLKHLDIEVTSNRYFYLQ
jgi:hypothetical protein